MHYGMLLRGKASSARKRGKRFAMHGVQMTQQFRYDIKP
jgi:hypothetical protein